MLTINARVLLSQLREAELFYLQTIRWEPEFWVERHLSPARIAVMDALMKYCSIEASYLDDKFSERALKNEIDKVAWRFHKVVEHQHIVPILALFSSSPIQIAAE